MAAASSCASEAAITSFLDNVDVEAAVDQDSSSMEEDSIPELAKEPTCQGAGLQRRTFKQKSMG
eukprot:9875679-Prorocentrum_lima.AAC.1